MFNYLECFGLGDLYNKENKREELVKYIKDNQSAKLIGFNESYINAYTNRSNNSGIQFCLREKGRIFGNPISIHHTNSCVWNIKLLKFNQADLVDGFYLVDSDTEGNDNKSNIISIIKLINKDILPSVLPGDILTVQVSALARRVRIFGEKDEEYQEYKFLNNHTKEDNAIITTFINTQKSEKDNIVFSDEVGVAGVIKEIYSYDVDLLGLHGQYLGAVVDTIFGELMIYFSDKQIEYVKKGNIKIGSIIECQATISGDAYLKEEMLKIELNYDNNFRLFRRAFSEENFSILESILSDDCIYKSNKFEIKDKINILDKLVNLAENGKAGVTMDKVTIAKVSHKKDYLKPGMDCLLYSQKGCNGHYLCYIKNNKENKIKEMIMCSPDDYAYAYKFPKKKIDNLYKELLKNKKKEICNKHIYQEAIDLYFAEERKKEAERNNPTTILSSTMYFIKNYGKEFIEIDKLIDSKITEDIENFKSKDYFFINEKIEELKLEFCNFHDKIIVMNYKEEKLLRDNLLFVIENFIEYAETNLEYYEKLKNDEDIDEINKKKTECYKKSFNDIDKLYNLYNQFLDSNKEN